MWKALALLTAISIPGAAFAQMDIRQADFAYFKEVVQVSGHTCDTCEGGHALGKGYKGMVFRVYCNENSLVYRAVLGDKYLCVEPWDTKRPRCEE